MSQLSITNPLEIQVCLFRCSENVALHASKDKQTITYILLLSTKMAGSIKRIFKSNKPITVNVISYVVEFGIADIHSFSSQTNLRWNFARKSHENLHPTFESIWTLSFLIKYSIDKFDLAVSFLKAIYLQ